MKLKHKILLLENIKKVRCKYCLSTENLTYDHKVPLIKGGGDEIGNIQVLCERCNSIKSDLSQKRVKQIFTWLMDVREKRLAAGKTKWGINIL